MMNMAKAAKGLADKAVPAPTVPPLIGVGAAPVEDAMLDTPAPVLETVPGAAPVGAAGAVDCATVFPKPLVVVGSGVAAEVVEPDAVLDVDVEVEVVD